MGFKLLLKMLGIIAIVFIVGVLGNLFLGQDLTYLALLIPIGLFSFVIYKFKKEGLVAVLYFVGVLTIIGGFSTRTSFYTEVIAFILGVALCIMATLLGKKWEVKLFNKRRKAE